MVQSQLVELIQTLKPEERVQIQHFATNPMFNNGRMKTQIIQLLAFCVNHAWDNPEANLEKRKVFSLIFQDQPFVDGKLEKLMVETQKVVRAFLIAQRYFRPDNEFHLALDFADEIRSRGLNDRYQLMVARLQKMLDEAPQNAQYYRQRFLLEYSIFDQASIQNQAKGDLNIPSTIHALEKDFYLKRLLLLNQLLLQLKITKLIIPDHIASMIEETMIPDLYLKESPYIKINYEVFGLLKKQFPTVPEIQSFFNLLLENELKVDYQSLRDFYTFLRNFCVLTLGSDYEQAELEQMLHNLYKDNLQRGYLHYEGKISRVRYWAVVTNALNVKAFDWAYAFIEQYKDELRDENETRDIYRLSLATYYFGTGQFAACLDNIPDTYTSVDLQMIGKRIELKGLYETQSELLPFKLDAFKMFLSRTSQKILSDSQRQTYLDFANLLHQIISSSPGDPKRSETLVARIRERKQSAEWRWLLEKAKALKEK